MASAVALRLFELADGVRLIPGCLAITRLHGQASLVIDPGLTARSQRAEFGRLDIPIGVPGVNAAIYAEEEKMETFYIQRKIAPKARKRCACKMLM